MHWLPHFTRCQYVRSTSVGVNRSRPPCFFFTSQIHSRLSLSLSLSCYYSLTRSHRRWCDGVFHTWSKFVPFCCSGKCVSLSIYNVCGERVSTSTSKSISFNFLYLPFFFLVEFTRVSFALVITLASRSCSQKKQLHKQHLCHFHTHGRLNV